MSEEEHENISYIVVPDGLAADNHGNALAAPSFIYRQVLDHVLCIANKNDSIFLAPANDFGCGIYEQEAAFEYLKKKIKTSLSFVQRRLLRSTSTPSATPFT